MQSYEHLLLWAAENGVKVNGLEPRRVPGRGVGIVATRQLKKDEVLLQVPASLLRTLDTVPRSVAKKLPTDMSVHGLLAADLALDDSSRHSAWNAVVPTRDELVPSLPISWHPELQKRLPSTARDLLRKQQAKLQRDWGAVHAAFPSLPEDDYLYAWLLVTTRTFYFVTPRTARLPREDRMVLQPVADLFNHADAGCGVAFDAGGFEVRADRAYAAGEEVVVCYGRHGNDLLLAEYGFAPARNRWDEVALDDAVLPRLPARLHRGLADCGFLGGYHLDAAAVCYRTQIALRALCMPPREWRRVVDGLDDGEAVQPDVDRLLVEVLREFEESARETIREVGGLSECPESQRQTLINRWLQIIDLLSSTISRLES